MKIQCPKCKMQYEVDDCEIERNAECVCGHRFVIKKQTFIRYKWICPLLLVGLVCCLSLFVCYRIQGEKIKYDAEVWNNNCKNIEAQYIEWQNETKEKVDALRFLYHLHKKAEVSHVELLTIQEKISVIRRGLPGMRFYIDPATRKINNFYNVAAKIKRQMIEKEKSLIDIKIKYLNQAKKTQEKIRESNSFQLGKYDIGVGILFFCVLFLIFLPFCRKK